MYFSSFLFSVWLLFFFFRILHDLCLLFFFKWIVCECMVHELAMQSCRHFWGRVGGVFLAA